MSDGNDVDVVVIGLGVLGASTLRHVARDGLRVVGLEQFNPGPHQRLLARASRAPRFPCHAPEYVALLRPAIDGWQTLEAEGGRRLFASVVVGLSHAFKFAPVIGRTLADLAEAGTTPSAIEPVRIDRLAPVAAD